MTTAGRDPLDRWFDGDGVRIHGLDWGGPDDGDPLLMLHGVAGNAWIWDDVAQRLRVALPGHRLVGIDGRDGGDTEHPATGYDRDRFAADVLAVHDQLGGRPMVLVGHSRSGWLTAWIAARHPERLERAVLVDPARLEFETGEVSDRYYAVIREGLGPFETEAQALAWAQASDPEAVFSAGRVRSFRFGYRPLPDGRLVGKLPPSAVGQLQAARADGRTVADALAGITVPTLLIVGSRQRADRIAQRMAYAERIPGVEVVRVAGTHFVHTDAPDEVAAAIAAFVGGAPGP